jgi:hypothetical protein
MRIPKIMLEKIKRLWESAVAVYEVSDVKKDNNDNSILEGLDGEREIMKMN